MTRKNQSYSKEFKAEAVKTVLENQLSISEGASRLEVPEGTLGQWRSNTGIYRDLLQPSAPSLTAGKYLPGSLQEKILSDGCLKKEQMAGACT